MLVLVLLSRFCLLTRSQSLDQDSWMDRAALSDGLCRYGNGQDCCWGWRRTDRGQCQPLCQQGCKHGSCVGPDRCECHPGFTGKACNHDLNECGLKPRPCKHRCMNTPGSFKCFCPDGYALQPDGSCRNVRTCYHANCQYGCEVMKGEVRCTCPSPGLRLGPDRRSCVDINECLLGRDVCSHRRKCINTFGSFICKCHLGFKLTYIDGRYTCIDKDTRRFCSLSPSSPKCRCKDGSCKVIPKMTLEPLRPRTTNPITTTGTTARSTEPPTTTAEVTATTITVATTSMAPSTVDTTTTSTQTTTTLTPTTAAQTTTPAQTTTQTTPTIPAQTTTTPTSTKTPTTPPTVSATTLGSTSSTPPPTTTESDTTPTPSPAVTTVAMTTTVLPTTSLATTTLNNRINKDVTHRQRGDVHIPRHPGNNQVWEFDIELGNTADDLGDDPDLEVFLRCRFNHGVCDWISDGDGDLLWETVETAAGERYLSVPELKTGQRSVRGARLAVPILPPWRHGNLCFSFSHWLTGHHVGVLQLFVRRTGRNQRFGSALWSRTGGHGWRQTQVTLAAHSVDRVLLKAERRAGRRGQVAVDDVTLRRGTCR
ncbi:nephronectin [Nematolebias whitei]|uniref:nephronectin n=1 Tax=Nematolebias whitei TaxID=451745 RepID=UPI0018983928|nr:nephronectin [Nematolebias whitei]